MLKQARQSLILESVNERKYVSLQDLMTLTASSESTIRADLVELGKSHKLIRLRGGAQALNSDSFSYELSLETKMEIQTEAKKAIARYAASLVKDHSMIYVDAGTTTYYFCEYLSAVGVKIMTNSVSIAKVLKGKGYQVYITGGEFKLTTDAFIGPMTREILSRFNFDMGFFGCNGVDQNQGITTPDYEEAVVKKTAMEQCKSVFVLADHTKFGTKTTVKFHDFDPTMIITDEIKDPSYSQLGITEAHS